MATLLAALLSSCAIWTSPLHSEPGIPQESQTQSWGEFDQHHLLSLQRFRWWLQRMCWTATNRVGPLTGSGQGPGRALQGFTGREAETVHPHTHQSVVSTDLSTKHPPCRALPGRKGQRVVSHQQSPAPRVRDQGGDRPGGSLFGTELSLATFLQAYYVFQKHFSPISSLVNSLMTQTDECYYPYLSVWEPGPEKLRDLPSITQLFGGRRKARTPSFS